MLGIETKSSDSLPVPRSVNFPDAKVRNIADRQTKELAQNFEATFLTQLLKEMRQSLEPESLFAGDKGDIQGGLFDFFMGKHLADSGGIGFADSIVRQLQLAGLTQKQSTHEPSQQRPATTGGTVSVASQS
jgi:peptidoglycan hydrolase FlgJ